MGRDGGKIQCPRGITIREHAHAQRVIVAFTFQGIECREVTGLPATHKNEKDLEDLALAEDCTNED